MTTVKVMGCGGRYSYLAFLPCRLCMAETDDECNKIHQNVNAMLGFKFVVAGEGEYAKG